MEKTGTERILSKLVNCPSHTRRAFDVDTLPAIARWAANLCRMEQADAIAACGHSGLVLAGAVSFITHIPVFAVRKRGEPVVAGDSSGMVSGVARGGKSQRWVWLDDSVGSGGTFVRSRGYLLDACLIADEMPVAMILYSVSEYVEREFWSYGYSIITGYPDTIEVPDEAKRIKVYGYI